MFGVECYVFVFVYEGMDLKSDVWIEFFYVMFFCFLSVYFIEWFLLSGVVSGYCLFLWDM